MAVPAGGIWLPPAAPMTNHGERNDVSVPFPLQPTSSLLPNPSRAYYIYGEDDGQTRRIREHKPGMRYDAPRESGLHSMRNRSLCPPQDTKKGRGSVSGATPHALCLSLTVRLSLLLRSHTLFSDAGLLTSEVAQVVQLSATYLTYLVHCDAVDVGRLNGENTLHAYSS